MCCLYSMETERHREKVAVAQAPARLTSHLFRYPSQRAKDFSPAAVTRRLQPGRALSSLAGPSRLCHRQRRDRKTQSCPESRLLLPPGRFKNKVPRNPLGSLSPRIPGRRSTALRCFRHSPVLSMNRRNSGGIVLSTVEVPRGRDQSSHPQGVQG